MTRRSHRTIDQVRQIRLAYEADPQTTIGVLAKQHGVNKSTIFRIVSRKSWKNVA